MSGNFKHISKEQKAPEKARPDAAKSEIHETGNSVGNTTSPRFRPWRSFLIWILGVALAWEIIARPILAIWQPEIVSRPTALHEISILLQSLLGAGF